MSREHLLVVLQHALPGVLRPEDELRARADGAMPGGWRKGGALGHYFAFQAVVCLQCLILTWRQLSDWICSLRNSSLALGLLAHMQA